MPYVIKAPVPDGRAKVFVFTALKTMYGGKHIAPGGTVFVFASEKAGGRGLVARGRVTAAEPVAKKRGVARQTPRVSVTVRREALAKRPLGRSALKPFTGWKGGRPEAELAFNSPSGHHRQNRRHLRHSRGVPGGLLLTPELICSTFVLDSPPALC